MERKEQTKKVIDYFIDFRWDIVRINNVHSRELR